MQKYEKYPEMFAVGKRIEQYRKKVKANNKMISEITTKKIEFKSLIKKNKLMYEGTKKQELHDLKMYFENSLNKARYQKTDITKLYKDYENNRNEIENKYNNELEEKQSKIDKELVFMNKSIEICIEENTKLKTNIQAAQDEQKNIWNNLKAERKARELELKNSLAIAKKDAAVQKKQIVKEYKEKYKSILNSFKEAHPEIGVSNINLILLNTFKVKDPKNDISLLKYDLLVSLNELTLEKNIKIKAQNNIVEAIKSEIRYNRGLSDKVTIKEFATEASVKALKLSNNRFLGSIKHSFFVILPLVMISAFMSILNNVILSTNQGGFLSIFSWTANGLLIVDKIKEIGTFISAGSLSLIGVFLAGAIGAFLGRTYQINEAISATLAVASFIILTPEFFMNNEKVYLSNHGMFTAIIASIMSIVLFNKIVKTKIMQIRISESMPNALARGFKVLIPFVIILVIMALTSLTIYEVGNSIGKISYGPNQEQVTSFNSIKSLLTSILQLIFGRNVDGYGGMVMVTIMEQLLWFFGIHPDGVLTPLTSPVFVENLAQNAAQIADGNEATQVWTVEFKDIFIHFGGSGGTLALVIAILIFSKQSNYKIIAWISLVPAIFNVNEPMIFGLPIFLNPILLIPFVFGPIIWGSIAYFVMHFGLTQMTYIEVNWIIPFFIGAYLSTQSILSVVLVIILITIATAIYSTFIVFSNRIEQKEIVRRYEEMIENEKKDYMNSFKQ